MNIKLVRTRRMWAQNRRPYVFPAVLLVAAVLMLLLSHRGGAENINTHLSAQTSRSSTMSASPTAGHVDSGSDAIAGRALNLNASDDPTPVIEITGDPNSPDPDPTPTPVPTSCDLPPTD